jgi:hypothetical protein
MKRGVCQKGGRLEGDFVYVLAVGNSLPDYGFIFNPDFALETQISRKGISLFVKFLQHWRA